MNFMPGDILFYNSRGTVYDVAITTVTHSKYVHVAIAISAAQKIESLSGGVMLTPINNETAARYWSYTEHVPDYDKTQFASALNWLQSMRGTLYGWDDAATAMIEALGFNLAVSNNHFDCSALATEFLMKCGGVTGLQNVTNPHIVTPALLANYLGVPS